MDDEILRSLIKRAKGYSYNEVQEEFKVNEDGELSLVKRKVCEKHCPPDSAALKTYLELTPQTSVADMSDSELERERTRLLRELEALRDSREGQARPEGEQKTEGDAASERTDAGRR